VINSTDEKILDNAAWFSLTGPHTHIAEGSGRARRYPFEVSPFYAIENFEDPQSWSDLALLTGSGGTAVLAGKGLVIPKDWTYVDGGFGIQMTGEEIIGIADSEVISLTPQDVPEMLDLVARAQPGPFLPCTIELGGYLGIRRDGALIAMAGCRLRPAGWREISAVCTDAQFRGQGLARRLVLAVSAQIRAEGEIPFLHVAESNENAIRLYESLGFHRRIPTSFAVIQAS
jgi:ribosomal protein S18 acetylase RimI-like enzyme